MPHAPKTHPKLSQERIKALSALARRIDAQEGEAIRSRAKAAFAHHERILAIKKALKTERMRKRMTLAAVSAKTGIAKSNLSRLENSRQHVTSLETLVRYAEAVGKSLRIEMINAPGRGRHLQA